VDFVVIRVQEEFGLASFQRFANALMVQMSYRSGRVLGTQLGQVQLRNDPERLSAEDSHLKPPMAKSGIKKVVNEERSVVDVSFDQYYSVR